MTKLKTRSEISLKIKTLQSEIELRRKAENYQPYELRSKQHEVRRLTKRLERLAE